MSAQTENQAVIAVITVVPKLGQPYAGGFFGGEIIVDDERYALVAAPKSEGEHLNLEYKKKKLATADGTDSDDEGFFNSELINNANHPAAQFCRALRIGEYDDWYLPSRDELAVLERNLGLNRKKTSELFREGGSEAFEPCWYWSSTEYARYSDFAWVVYFYNGYQSYYDKDYSCGVRAVRRLKI